MNTATATAPAADSSTTHPDAELDAATRAGAADPAAAGLHADRARRAPRAAAAPATSARGGSIADSLVRIRELGPGDGDVNVVDTVFAGLSAHSRYLRFHAPIVELSAATRRDLTALDGCTHVALAAFAQGHPIGIVRIIDLGNARGELAVEVVDRWQGCGVGTQLLQAARNLAVELGYRELVGEMLTVNAAARAALRRVFRITQTHRHDSELTMTMVVDRQPAPTSPVQGLVA